MSKFVGTGPSPYEKRIYRAAVPRRLRNTGLKMQHHKPEDPNLQQHCSNSLKSHRRLFSDEQTHLQQATVK